MAVKLELSDDFVNELQRRSIIKLIDALKWAKSADIHVRKDGQDHVFEADWLKHLKFGS
jgi:hypothetical protein